MATFIETDQKIMIDPGTSLGPKRFGYPPWKTEFDALYETRGNIQEHAKLADIVTISHYHHDHYTPFSLGRYLDSNHQYAEEIYKDKKIFIKNPTNSINKSQQKRANELLDNLKNLNCEVIFSDGGSFAVGDTKLKFSNPLPHGPFGSRMGYVVIVTITWNDMRLVHASDVQGPIFDGSKEYIIDENPDILIISGPPIYLQGFALEARDIEVARNNLIEIANQVPKIVIDHHLLRDISSLDFIESIKKETNGNIKVASELLGKKPILLEAQRKKLYFEQ
jgi:predicted metallo-beta-lactamase superfamily hydrolase